MLWLARTPIGRFLNTKLALSIKNGSLEVTSYRGAIIDFKILRDGNTFYFQVLSATSELEFKNLSFGKLRDSGEDLILEVKEKYRPRVHVDTRFVISLYNRADGTNVDVFIGQFPIDESNVIFQNGVFYLLIGNLNFPAKYKKYNTKLRIHLSIYREAIRQTRVLGIKGLFRI